MRRLHWLVVSFGFCWAVFAVDCRRAAAEPDAARSEIRLCSSTQPVRESTPAVAPHEPALIAGADVAPQPVGVGAGSNGVAQEVGNDAKPQGAAPSQGNVTTAAPRPRMPAGFYPNESVRAALSQAPGRVPIQSSPRMTTRRPGGKPFQSIESQPTVSPYLYLNSGGSHANLVTNYFGFVRPQLDQMEAGRQQQREIQQLKNQVKKLSSGSGGGQPVADTPGAAHYMDTAQFYRFQH